MNIKEIKEKYLADSDVSKALNERFHKAKAQGKKLSKFRKTNAALSAYIKNANAKLGRSVEIYTINDFDGDTPRFGINWSARGTRSVPETQQFIKQLQMAVDFIKNVPKAPAPGDDR